MKHAILGMGAIGGLMGVGLSVIGEQVTLVVRPSKLADYPRELWLQQPAGSFTATAMPVSKLTEAVDCLWIATKTYQLEEALGSVQASVAMVVPLLNGIDHVAVLRSRFGDDRVVPATIAVGADRVAEGRFRQGSPVRLNLARNGEPALSPVLAGLQHKLGFLCGFVNNEQTLLWSKLSFLAPFALTTAASSLDKGGVLADPGWKQDLYASIAETLAVARAEGAEVQRSHIDDILMSSPDAMRSSMAKDLTAGRELELDGIAGPVVRGGERHGIPVPVTTKLIDIVRGKLGHGQRRPMLRTGGA